MSLEFKNSEPGWRSTFSQKMEIRSDFRGKISLIKILTWTYSDKNSENENNRFRKMQINKYLEMIGIKNVTDIGLLKKLKYSN